MISYRWATDCDEALSFRTCSDGGFTLTCTSALLWVDWHCSPSVLKWWGPPYFVVISDREKRWTSIPKKPMVAMHFPRYPHLVPAVTQYWQHFIFFLWIWHVDFKGDEARLLHRRVADTSQLQCSLQEKTWSMICITKLEEIGGPPRQNLVNHLLGGSNSGLGSYSYRPRLKYHHHRMQCKPNSEVTST
jgi:hypothetical protein